MRPSPARWDRAGPSSQVGYDAGLRLTKSDGEALEQVEFENTRSYFRIQDLWFSESVNFATTRLADFRAHEIPLSILGAGSPAILETFVALGALVRVAMSRVGFLVFSLAVCIFVTEAPQQVDGSLLGGFQSSVLL